MHIHDAIPPIAFEIVIPFIFVVLFFGYKKSPLFLQRALIIYSLKLDQRMPLRIFPHHHTHLANSIFHFDIFYLF